VRPTASLLHEEPSLVTKGSAVQKISSRQTLIDIFNICCDLHLELINPVFYLDTIKLSVVVKESLAKKRQ